MALAIDISRKRPPFVLLEERMLHMPVGKKSEEYKRERKYNCSYRHHEGLDYITGYVLISMVLPHSIPHRFFSYVSRILAAYPAATGIVSSSSVVFSATIVVNGFQFLFNLITVRNLTVEQYGVLQTIITFFNITNIATALITLQLTKYLGRFIINKKYKAASALVHKSSLIGMVAGLLVFSFVILLNSRIPLSIGKVTGGYIAASIMLFVLGFPISVYRAMMKAYLHFMDFSLNSVFQQVSKLLLAALFLLLGYKLGGVVWSMYISSILTIFYSLWLLRTRLFVNPFEKTGILGQSFTRESISITIGSLGLTSLLSIDLVLAQHFLAEQAGLYAGLALLGKGIILTTLPLSTVLFPLIIQAKSSRSGQQMLKVAAFGAAAIGISIVALYVAAPEAIVSIVLSASYKPIVPFIPYYGAAMLFYAISHVVVNGFMALDEFIPGYATCIAAILQSAAIISFHRSLFDLVSISLSINGTLLVFVLLFTFIKLPDITMRYYNTRKLPTEQ